MRQVIGDCASSDSVSTFAETNVTRGIVTENMEHADSPGYRRRMQSVSYARHRFPSEVIQHAVWLCLRFTLSYRDVEDLLAERGLDVS